MGAKILSKQQWVNDFSDVDFGDERVNNRFYSLMNAMSEDFHSSLSQVCKSSSAKKAAYRFFNNSRVEEREVLRAHREACVERAKNYDRIIAVQDTTAFNFHSYRDSIKGLGSLNDGGSSGPPVQGLQVHASLLLSPQGEALGLSEWTMYSPGKEAIQKEDTLKLHGDTEASRWFEHIDTLADIREELGKPVICTADREADMTTLLIYARRKNVDVVLRSKIQRGIALPTKDTLLYYLKRQAPKFTYKITVEKRQQVVGKQWKKKRSFHQRKEIELKVHYASVELLYPTNERSKKLRPTSEELTCSALLVEEVHPSDLENNIQWILFTTLRVTNTAEALDVIKIYRLRWQIEEYFKALKSGCRAGEIRLESARKISRYVCMKSVIAAEVYRLKHSSRERPEDPCTDVLSEDQWKVLTLIILQLDGKKLKVPSKPPSLHQAALWIGRLGGHAGRKRDGPPGVITLTRGFEELLSKVEGFKLARQL